MAGDFGRFRHHQIGTASLTAAAEDTMRSKTPMTSRETVVGLRQEVQAALAEGIDKDSMVLRLTARDDSALKRHPDVGINEIDFRNGEMHFLGVRVVKGETSVLDRSPA